jgi:tetratricopeptide (TPR) repeat protein
MMVREPDNVDAWIEVSYANNSLGSVAQARGDHRAAAAAFERSIALKRRALARRPNDPALRAELADSLSWLGSALQAEGELHQAIELFEQEQSELTALRTAAPTELDWTFRLVGAAHRHAKLLAATGNDAAAADELRWAVTLAQGLIQHDPTNRYWQRAVLNVEALAAEVQANLGNYQKALDLETAAAVDLARLTKLDPANQAWMLLESVNLINLGESLLRLGRPQEAGERFQAALDRMRQGAGQARGNSELEQKMARSLIGLAQVRLAQREPAAAQEACQEAIAVLQPLAHSDIHNYYAQDLWVRSHLCAGQGGRVIAAREWLSRIGYGQAGYLRFLSQLQ